MVDEKEEKKIKLETVGVTVENNIERLSQELFGKPSKDIKYLYVTNYIHQQLLQEELARTGLYQWINAFKGDVKFPRDVVDYSVYDIVQVNMSPQDMHLVGNVRERLGENSKTKIVLNNDFTTELWQNAFEYPTTMSREMNHADMIFGTEYFQTTAITEISGRKCYVIPHPADVRRLKSLPEIPKKEIITTIWRRYDNFSFIPSLMSRNHGLTTQLIGYDKNIDKKTWFTTTLYDYVCAGTNYFDFCDQMRESKIILDPFTLHSFSRATVDTAALGVAVVGSNRTQSMNVCYPYTLIDPYDVIGARKLIRKLQEDKEFYKKVVDTAKERVEFYNIVNSKERYLSSLCDALKAGRIPKKRVNFPENRDRGRGDDINLLQAKEINRKNVESEKSKNNNRTGAKPVQPR